MRKYEDIFAVLEKNPCFRGREISSLVPSKLGMTNDSYIFECEGKRYILRIPGPGTEKLINRSHEKEVYEVIQKHGFAQDVLFFDGDSGIKISRYIENSHPCRPENEEEVKGCIRKLKELHRLHLEVNHHFSLWEEIENYERYRENIPSCHEDYEEVKERMRLLLPFVREEEKDCCLCHIDAVCDNFLLNGQISLIDWEYAAMQDPDLDIAMFIIYAGYGQEESDRYIALFMEEENERRLYKIYAYIALAGFLWSNWCEYKALRGVRFGEYAERQYAYAKVYGAKVKEYLWPE